MDENRVGKSYSGEIGASIMLRGNRSPWLALCVDKQTKRKDFLFPREADVQGGGDYCEAARWHAAEWEGRTARNCGSVLRHCGIWSR